MPSPKSIAAVLLLTLGLGLAGANVWFTAARSTIPLRLEGTVTNTEVRREKHPGRDDVFLIKLQSQPAIQVDEPVYRAMAIGQRVAKPRWSRQLRIDDRTLPLAWSRDCGGMIASMPMVLLVLAGTMAAAIWRIPHPES